jgi:hypothetical protein
MADACFKKVGSLVTHPGQSVASQITSQYALVISGDIVERLPLIVPE